jgi:hypothetical protein
MSSSSAKSPSGEAAPQQPLHQVTGPLLLADDRQRGHEPERAYEEGVLLARHAVVSLAGAVAQHEAVFCQLVGDGPKGTTRVWDDEHLVICDLMSPQTVENLRTNRAVEVNVVDPIARRGYRFKGSAQVLGEGALFERILAFYQSGEPPMRDVRARIRISFS